MHPAVLLRLPCALLPCLVGGVGLYLLVRLRAFPLLHPIRTVRTMLTGARLGESFSALALALSGTLGVGNVTGVAIAIAAGGPGAILWMWVSGCLAMLVRYGEVLLTLDSGLGRRRSVRPHALLVLLAAPLLGGALQSAAAAEAVCAVAGVPPIAVGAGLALLSIPLSRRGGERIRGVTARLLLPLSLLYTVLTLGTVLCYADRIPRVMGEIVRSAFSPSASVGGLVGCISVGFSRGLLSNEAGCGTAPYAHAEASGVLPVRQGLFGMAEVAIDTLFFCTLTALALLLPADGGIDGITPLLSAAGRIFGRAAPVALSLSILLFAYAAQLAFLRYASTALTRLGGGGRSRRLHLSVFALAITLGALLPAATVAAAVDPLLLGMACLTLPEIIRAADRAVALSAAAGLIRLRRKRGCATAGLRRRQSDAPAYPSPRARSSDR